MTRRQTRVPILTATVFLSWFASAQNTPEPITLGELETWMRLPEASRPVEEIVQQIRSRWVAFQLTPESNAALRTMAADSRPEDSVRQILQSAADNFALERIKPMLLDPAGPALRELAGVIRTRGLQLPYSLESEGLLRNSLGRRNAFAADMAIALLWPPIPPRKPRFELQEWREPGLMRPAPYAYDPNAASGRVTLDLTVDGSVVIALKHDRVFYNVACGADVRFDRIEFDSPIPKLSPDRIEQWIELPVKPRGKAFLCPGDPLCDRGKADRSRDKHEKLCNWYDVEDEADERGYFASRLIIEDDKPGAAKYQAVYCWTARPYSLEYLVADLVKYGSGPELVNRIYRRGAAFSLDPAAEKQLTDAGATKREFDEIRRNTRVSNRPRAATRPGRD
ncbi:MAG: hypothetical protein ACKV2U_32860 [Bryobacteraceae bacterium]